MLSDNPLISVIMPAYNCAAYVSRAIESILQQSYSNTELLVGDDASTDHTRRVIAKIKDPRMKVVHFDHNIGAPAVRNNLIGLSRGEIIAFQDADDFSHVDRLARQVSVLVAEPKLAMTGCQVAYLGAREETIRLSNHPLNYQQVLARIYDENVFNGATLMVRRAILIDIGGAYRDYFCRLSYEDYDLCLRIAEKYACCNLPDVLYYYRQRGNSLSKTVSVDRHLSRDVARHLSRQRRDRGTDDLQEGHPEKVDQYVECLKRPFYDDPALIYRTYASHFMYDRMYGRAIATAIGAVRISPMKIVNYRTLLYCIRKSLFR